MKVLAMIKFLSASVPPLLLSGCLYSHSADGTYARIDLPVQQQTVIHKTVTVQAPPGTTVIYGEAVPVSSYGNGGVYYPYARPVYRLQGQGGSITQEYE